jgi:glycosyltransferase involved in cell wall biosynthesis
LHAREEAGVVSILILTRNEEQDLPGCLASVAWSDDVHVFDSCSTDRTAEIARAAGVNLRERPFDNYAAQRNAALEEIPFKHEWIFLLDCDERLSLSLAEEMVSAIARAPRDVNAFRVRRNDHFLGSWLRHAQIMPFYTRLVRRGRARYVREVNEVLEVEGQIGDLRTPFDHYPFSKGLTRWFEKHNTYSTMESSILAEGSFRSHVSWKTAFFERDFHQRRRAQKAIFYCMPCRPLLRWAYLMFYRGAILDGRAGCTYALLQAIYEYLIVLKTRELRAGRAARAEKHSADHAGNRRVIWDRGRDQC